MSLPDLRPRMALQDQRRGQLLPALQPLPASISAARKWAEAADFHWHLAATDRIRFLAAHPLTSAFLCGRGWRRSVPARSSCIRMVSQTRLVACQKG